MTHLEVLVCPRSGGATAKMVATHSTAKRPQQVSTRSLRSEPRALALADRHKAADHLHTSLVHGQSHATGGACPQSGLLCGLSLAYKLEGEVSWMPSIWRSRRRFVSNSVNTPSCRGTPCRPQCSFDGLLRGLEMDAPLPQLVHKYPNGR